MTETPSNNDTLAKPPATAADLPPIKYGNFTNRMIATSIDLGMLFMLILPLVDMIMNQLFGPIDANGLMAVMSSPEVNYNPTHLNDSAARLMENPAFWQFLKEQHMIERVIVENLLQVIFIGLYVIPFWFRYSTTPGKMVMRLEIRDSKSGELMTERQAVLRFFGYIVSIIPFSLGFMWIGVDKKCRGFHDMIARTVVVVKPKKRKAPLI